MLSEGRGGNGNPQRGHRDPGWEQRNERQRRLDEFGITSGQMGEHQGDNANHDLYTE
jgi:hypothetical protein